MASSKDAFEKFWIWKKSRTLLKVKAVTKEEPLPKVFTGAVVLPEEEFLRVSFLSHDDRSPCTVDLRDCSFDVGERLLLAERAAGEFLKCEDTGKRWGKSDVDM